MAERISRKRKTSLTERMRAAKQLKHIKSTSSPELSLSGLSSWMTVFRSLVQVQVIIYQIFLIEEGDEDYNDQFSDDDADGVYQDWLATVDREMMALMLHMTTTLRLELFAGTNVSELVTKC